MYAVESSGTRALADTPAQDRATWRRQANVARLSVLAERVSRPFPKTVTQRNSAGRRKPAIQKACPVTAPMQGPMAGRMQHGGQDIRVEFKASLSVLAAGRRVDEPADRSAYCWPLLEPTTLLRCYSILAAARHAQAALVLRELQRRLEVQLAQLSDAAAQERMLRALPHWRETARLGEQR
jgi:hypothetical protein